MVHSVFPQYQLSSPFYPS